MDIPTTDTQTIPDEAVTALAVGDRVQVDDQGREDDYGTVIKGPHRMFTNDTRSWVSVEVPRVGVATAHFPVSTVRRVPPDEEQEIWLMRWVVSGEQICDDPDEYNHPHQLFVHEGDLPEIIRTYLAANGLTPPGTTAADLSADKDTETAKPDLTMGNRPDGSPWVISADFAPGVRVDGYGALRLYGKAIAPATAHRLATGLLAAIAWLENDGAAKAERAASLRGEQ